MKAQRVDRAIRPKYLYKIMFAHTSTQINMVITKLYVKWRSPEAEYKAQRLMTMKGWPRMITEQIS